MRAGDYKRRQFAVKKDIKKSDEIFILCVCVKKFKTYRFNCFVMN